MKNLSKSPRTPYVSMLGALLLVASISVAGGVTAATSNIDDGELLALGFKVLVATTPVQNKWVQSLAPGQIRSMQRNGRKFFIFPDKARNQVYVGGPAEYAAYKELHPESGKAKQDAAKKTTEYRLKQDEVMRNATARDLSDPFLGVSWYDLGW